GTSGGHPKAPCPGSRGAAQRLRTHKKCRRLLPERGKAAGSFLFRGSAQRLGDEAAAHHRVAAIEHGALAGGGGAGGLVEPHQRLAVEGAAHRRGGAAHFHFVMPGGQGGAVGGAHVRKTHASEE